MCQVAPVTYPCCRRIYALISKTPGCPDDWPRSKCPPEFCIQIHQHEPKARTAGVCWRCTADNAGETGLEREKRRPRIDRAPIVAGLEEFDVVERKKRIELGGQCWYCNASGGCHTCGSQKMPLRGSPSDLPQMNVCWYCGRSRNCISCGPKDITKSRGREDSLPASPMISLKRSRAHICSTSQSGMYKNKRTKMESPDIKVSSQASNPISPLPPCQWMKLASHPPPAASSPYHSPPFEVTAESDLRAPFDGGYGPQVFYPKLVEKGSQSLPARNQQIDGVDEFEQPTDDSLLIHRSTTSGPRSNGQYLILNPRSYVNYQPSGQLPDLGGSPEGPLEALVYDGNFERGYHGFENHDDALLSQFLDE